jgi:hypothetical protein
VIKCSTIATGGNIFMTHDNRVKVINKAAPAGFMFFMLYIGAAIYFIEKTTGGFWDVVLALLQAIVWPIFFIYHALHLLGV